MSPPSEAVTPGAAGPTPAAPTEAAPTEAAPDPASPEAAPLLELPPEPVEALSGFRAATCDGVAWADQDLTPLVSSLWQSWGPSLEAAGMARPGLEEVVTGYRRELWLWVVGDRIWAQCGSGLVGRVLRRLPTPVP